MRTRKFFVALKIFCENLLQEREYDWLLASETGRVFQRVQGILQSCLSLVPRKVAGTAAGGARQEKFLIQSSGNDNVRCMLTLLGDNIAHVEVMFRHPKAPNHIYKGTAQPDLQQKLQQLQDVGNHVQNALIIVGEILAAAVGSKMTKGGPAILHSLVETQHHIRRAQAALMLPKRRQLNDLQKNPLQKCFLPPLPQDVVLSFYISSCKLLCSVYLIQPTAGVATAKQPTVHVYQGDCTVPWLNEILSLLASALHQCQMFSDKVNFSTLMILMKMLDCSQIHVLHSHADLMRCLCEEQDEANAAASSETKYEMHI